MIPLEVTHQALATPEIVQTLREAHRPVATLAADLLVFFAESYRNVFGFPAPPVHDPCAVAAVFDPTIVTSYPAYVQIETGSELTRGRTVCDVYNTQKRNANVMVGYELDVKRFWRILTEILISY